MELIFEVMGKGVDYGQESEKPSLFESGRKVWIWWKLKTTVSKSGYVIYTATSNHAKVTVLLPPGQANYSSSKKAVQF